MPTELGLKKAFGRLEPIYPLRGEAEKVRRVWVSVLKGVSDDELLAAVDAYLQTDAKRFPKPGELLTKVKAARSRSTTSTDDEDYHKLRPGELREMLARYGVEPPGLSYPEGGDE